MVPGVAGFCHRWVCPFPGPLVQRHCCSLEPKCPSKSTWSPACGVVGRCRSLWEEVMWCLSFFSYEETSWQTPLKDKGLILAPRSKHCGRGAKVAGERAIAHSGPQRETEHRRMIARTHLTSSIFLYSLGSPSCPGMVLAAFIIGLHQLR